MTDDRVSWFSRPRPTDDACFLCDNRVGNEVFMSSLHADARRGHMEVARCGACASAWFPQFDEFEVQYPDDDGAAKRPDFRLLVHHYLELVSGLHWKIGLAERLPFADVTSALDIGCNAGSFLDYIHRAWGAEVEGLEPSAYGTVGRELLGLPIEPTYMSQAAHLDGRAFDLVYATEVLEHVPDPQTFLAELRSFTRPGGLAFITTPRAGSLAPTTPRGELLAALSTGGHRFLASPEQLTEMIRDAGFAWSKIEPFGMTQFAVMADEPVDVGSLVDPLPRLVDHYQHRVDDPAVDMRVALGDRLNRYVAGRRVGEAGDPALEDAMARNLTTEFGIDLHELSTVIERQAAANDLAAFGRDMPYLLPEYLFWRGQRDDVSEQRRTELFECSAMLTALGLRADPVNLFVYIEPLTLALQALAGRRPGRWSSELGRLIAQVPEAAHLRLEPADVSPIRRLAESIGAPHAFRRLRSLRR